MTILTLFIQLVGFKVQNQFLDFYCYLKFTFVPSTPVSGDWSLVSRRCWCWCHAGAGVGVTPVLVLVSRRCWCWCHTGAGAGVGITPVLVLVSRRCWCWCHAGAGAGVTPVLVPAPGRGGKIS